VYASDHDILLFFVGFVQMEAVSHQGKTHLRFFSAMCTMEFAGLTKYQADANDEYRRVVS